MKEKSRERYWKERFTKVAQECYMDEEIGLWRKHGFERRMNVFFQIFNKCVNNSRRILDVGCGSGAYCKILANQGHVVIGVDYSEAVIRKAIEKLEGSRVSYGVADVYSLPFKDNSFDVVYSIGLFQHLSEEEKAVDEIKRVLRDEGLLVLITLNSFSIKAIYWKVKSWLFSTFTIKNSLDEQHERTYNPFKFKTLLKKNGFYKIRIHSVYIFPESLRLLETLFDKVDKIFFSAPLLPAAHAFALVAQANVSTTRKEHSSCKSPN